MLWGLIQDTKPGCVRISDHAKLLPSMLYIVSANMIVEIGTVVRLGLVLICMIIETSTSSAV
jgi:hypothetical protein